MKNTFTNAKIVGRGVDPETYHNQEPKRGSKEFVMSRSELAEFSKCPARWLAGYRDGESSSTQYGSLMDCLLLDNSRLESKFAVRPETYVNEKRETKDWSGNATVCKAWKADAEANGKTVVKSEDVIEVTNAITRLKKSELAWNIIKGSEKQVYVTADYTDHETKIVVPLKILIDLEPLASSEWKSELADLKTSASASPSDWQRSVGKFYYHWQAALYLDIYNAATGEERDGFINVVQESFSPWQPAVHILSLEFIQLGREQYTMALRHYCECIATGTWNGYTGQMINGMILCEPLPYMVKQTQ